MRIEIYTLARWEYCLHCSRMVSEMNYSSISVIGQHIREYNMRLNVVDIFMKSVLLSEVAQITNIMNTSKYQ